MKSIVYLVLLLAISFALIHCSSSKSSGNQSGEVMTLLPSVKEQQTNFITFSLKATRNQIVEGEYLPSSEDLRIFIYDSNGKPVWNSNHNMNYLMVIGDVMPNKVGQTHEYIAQWNKSDNSGKRLPPGTYTAKLIIPAQPTNYSADLAFKME